MLGMDSHSSKYSEHIARDHTKMKTKKTPELVN